MAHDEIRDSTTVPPSPISFREALRAWTRVALLSFGGPAAQIATMHRILVEEKRWISESRFLHALNYCMLLPGPEAQQLATYIGWLMHRTAGGLAAGLLFILPGVLAIMTLSVLYAGFHEVRAVEALFFGLKPAVMAVVFEAVLRIGRRALKNSTMYAVAAAAFVGIFFFDAPFPLVVLAAGAFGLIGERLRPTVFAAASGHGGAGESDEASVVDAMLARGGLEHTRPSARRAVRVAVVWSLVWLAPLAAIALVLGPENVYARIGLFFSKTAMVTFGGAYSVLAYVAQQAVDTYGWLRPGEMLDGLGMAETTPGPLIMVLQFVGFLGAYRDPGALHPMLAGALGGLLATWVTFAPCFLWIFLGAPYIEALRGNRSLHAALSTITAAVVGVVLNLSIWFAIHTVFGTVGEYRWGRLHLLVPAWNTVNWPSLLIAAGALLAMLRFKAGMGKTLAVSAGIGLAYHLLLR